MSTFHGPLNGIKTFLFFIGGLPADTARNLHRFGTPSGGKVHNPQGLMVAAVDVFRRLPLDWILVGKKTGESTALNALLDTLQLNPGDVAMMDRGLPNRKLFGLLLERGIDIVARMTTSQAIAWTEVTEFLKTGKSSASIEFQVGEKGDLRTVKLRLVEKGEEEGPPSKWRKGRINGDCNDFEGRRWLYTARDRQVVWCQMGHRKFIQRVEIDYGNRANAHEDRRRRRARDMRILDMDGAWDLAPN